MKIVPQFVVINRHAADGTSTSFTDGQNILAFYLAGNIVVEEFVLRFIVDKRPAHQKVTVFFMWKSEIVLLMLYHKSKSNTWVKSWINWNLSNSDLCTHRYRYISYRKVPAALKYTVTCKLYAAAD